MSRGKYANRAEASRDRDRMRRDLEAALHERDQPQRNAVAAMAALFARQEAAIAAIDVRQKNVEDVVAVTTRKVDRNEAEVAELRARLEALEQRNAP